MSPIPAQKPSLAITIRSFTLDDTTKMYLESHFCIGYVNTLGRRLSESELIEAIRNIEVVIAGTESFSQKVIEASPKLKIISRVGVGTDSIDLDVASKKNIRVMITAVSTIQPVAEHTIALILALIKRIAEYIESQKHYDHTIKQGFLLAGKTVGVVGIGRIGSRVGELLFNLGCTIIFFDPFVSKSPNVNFKRAESLHELLGLADIITLHIPAKKGDRPLLDREAFNQCRNGIIIINTARGSLIDEQALNDALNRGTVAGAGLDVTVEEPYSGPLLSSPHVIITPHVASNTIESRRAMEHEAVENIMKVITKG